MKLNSIRPLDAWEDYPNIDLYMDQVLDIIDRQLADFYEESGTRVMTAAMVNNYVKKDLLPPPVKKKYNREQVALLVIVGILKQVLSIAQMKQLLDLLLIEHNDAVEEMYRNFQILMNQKIRNRQPADAHTDTSASYILDLTLTSFLTRLAASALLEQLLS